MFTGIIKQTGRFKAYHLGKKEMSIDAPEMDWALNLGDSLAVNGVCLSLTKKKKEVLSFNLSPETLKTTTLGSLRRGDRLNLEPPLTLSDPLSGHLVTGHIDDTGKILKVIPRKEGKRIVITYPSQLRPFFIPKGSVAVDGVSLTIACLEESRFQVEIIPLTLKNTNLSDLRPGSEVNLECDILGKYMYNYSVTNTKKLIEDSNK
ncbi:MAG: riboflavin synthase [Candidatus Aminicenantes bacterium]|nr:riboflavin synthase [Candidatus Aminicenantes bacterium]